MEVREKSPGMGGQEHSRTPLCRNTWERDGVVKSAALKSWNPGQQIPVCLPLHCHRSGVATPGSVVSNQHKNTKKRIKPCLTEIQTQENEFPAPRAAGIIWNHNFHP